MLTENLHKSHSAIGVTTLWVMPVTLCQFTLYSGNMRDTRADYRADSWRRKARFDRGGHTQMLTQSQSS